MTSNAKKIGWALLTKIGILTAIVGAYTYHSELKKIDYNIFEKKQPIAENFYQNPPILEVQWNANKEGTIETYLVNTETGNKVEIMYDMLPKNNTMIKTMAKRFSIDDLIGKYSGEEQK